MMRTETGKPTIRDVAKAARVGIMTVSRVLNNHPSVRASTRKKVEAAITQLGYRQNEAARLLKGQRAKMIGLIVPDLSDQFFAMCAHTVQHIARSHGYMTLVVSSERDADLEYEQGELMASRNFSGLLIVTSAKAGDERVRQLQNTGLVVVAFDRPLPGVGSDCVLIDNRGAAEEAVGHLIDHGHRHIVCVGYDEDVYTVYERLQGYLVRMRTSDLEPQLALSLLAFEDVRKWLTEVLARNNRPTAVFSLNHRTSVYLLQALAEAKVRIPEEMAVVGFDDFDLAGILSPPLTTVAQSPAELARRSTALLFSAIHEAKNGATPAPAKILLPTKLMIRQSCGLHEGNKPLPNAPAEELEDWRKHA